jgi:hypothetical protein
MIGDVARRLLKEKHIFVPTGIGDIELLFSDDDRDVSFVLKYEGEDVGYFQYKTYLYSNETFGFGYVIDHSSFFFGW